MPHHFRAFSFVDRITSIENGRRVRGRYTIPRSICDFPLALVGEAVGQLAAWAAMAMVGFRQRPVAGLAGRIELLREPRPGQVLELAAELEGVDGDSVQYHGTAEVAGTQVIRLTDCVGPMMPLADFDDPEALRRRFQELCESGNGTSSFPGLPPLALERTGGAPGQSVSGDFQVPNHAPFFADHFPRRAVFPGSLLMYVNLKMAAALARELPQPEGADKPERKVALGFASSSVQSRVQLGAAENQESLPCGWMPATIQDMKLRSFIPPGTHLQLQATLKQRTANSARVLLETRNGTEVIATSTLLLKPGGQG
jgi:3-hydroxymyristoyl/3-hydroxydecanoyl-(acyl carrier protein) dehydratase